MLICWKHALFSFLNFCKSSFYQNHLRRYQFKTINVSYMLHTIHAETSSKTLACNRGDIGENRCKIDLIRFTKKRVGIQMGCKVACIANSMHRRVSANSSWAWDCGLCELMLCLCSLYHWFVISGTKWNNCSLWEDVIRLCNFCFC